MTAGWLHSMNTCQPGQTEQRDLTKYAFGQVEESEKYWWTGSSCIYFDYYGQFSMCRTNLLGIHAEVKMKLNIQLWVRQAKWFAFELPVCCCLLSSILIEWIFKFVHYSCYLCFRFSHWQCQNKSAAIARLDLIHKLPASHTELAKLMNIAYTLWAKARLNISASSLDYWMIPATYVNIPSIRVAFL